MAVDMPTSLPLQNRACQWYLSNWSSSTDLKTVHDLNQEPWYRNLSYGDLHSKFLNMRGLCTIAHLLSSKTPPEFPANKQSSIYQKIPRLWTFIAQLQLQAQKQQLVLWSNRIRLQSNLSPLPGLMAASVWITFLMGTPLMPGTANSRPTPLTMPCSILGSVKSV